MNTFNFTGVQGSTYTGQYQATNQVGSVVNLSGYSARGYARLRPSDTGILLDLAPQIDPSYTNGLVNINIPATGMAVLPVGIAFYDVELSSGDFVFKGFGGKLIVYPEFSW